MGVVLGAVEENEEGFMEALVGYFDEEQRQNKENKENERIHTNIRCDGCNHIGIPGTRYKCIICADFDLCEACDGKGLHNEHPMLRITDPDNNAWLSIFQRGHQSSST